MTMEGFASVYNVIKALNELDNAHWIHGIADHDDIDYIHKSFWKKFLIPTFCHLQFLDNFYCLSLRKKASLTLFEQLNQWKILHEIGTFNETFFSQETFRTHLSFDLRHALSFFSKQLSPENLKICENEIYFRSQSQNVSLQQALNEFYQVIHEIIATRPDSEILFEWYCLGGEGLCNPHWGQEAIDQKTQNVLKRKLHVSEWHQLTKAVKLLLLFDKRVLIKRLVSCLKVKKEIPINTLFSSKSQTYSKAMDYSVEGRLLLNITSMDTSLQYFKTPKKANCLVKVFEETFVPEEGKGLEADSTSTLDSLYTLCKSHRHTTEDALEMISKILEMFLNPLISTDVIIERLVDLFGLDHLNEIEFFLKKKKECVDDFLKKVQEYILQENVKEKDAKVFKSEPPLGCNVQFVKSSRDKKVISKNQRHSCSQSENNSVEKFLAENSLTHVLQLLNKQNMKFTKQDERPMDQSFSSRHDKLKSMPSFVTKSCLPVGTKHEKNKGIEIFHFPSAQPIQINETSLVSTGELPQWAQTAFTDIKTFNLVQSKVFQCVFNSQNNFLVSAPTGCGKSNIALVAILSSLTQYQENPNVFQCPKPENFRVVYIAPMKSLASEIARKYSKALSPLGIKVQDLTSDVHLSREELNEVHIIVTVCEKFDILSRKVGYRGVSSENSLMSCLKCVIFDEIHLLNDNRGSILEAVVARILLYMEAAQQFIRLVGLSATLPNWKDIGDFLNVAPENMFHFNQSYRPIPLDVSVIGLNSSSLHLESRSHFDTVCYNNVVKELREGGQILIFVHARNQTLATAEDLIDRFSRNSDDKILFSFPNDLSKSYFEVECRKAKDHRCLSIMQQGVGVHHAGLSASDRRLVESLFSKGYIKVLVSTSTLAWGVNLPARCVIIRGTQFFDTHMGSDQSLNILDILQMFGRAGRPQFDTTGKGILITNHDKMSWYLNLLTNQIPIESQLYKNLNNALNAEISIGTIQYEEEGIRWLSYTYLYIRMLRDPIKYGLKPSQIQSDTTLNEFRRNLISQSAQYLEDIRMIRISGKDNAYNITEFGRIAAEYYIDCDTAVHFMKRLKDIPDGFQDLDVLETLGDAKEFESLTVRSEELDELYALQSQCLLLKKNKTDTPVGKVIILIQVYLKRMNIHCSSLVADTLYISQNIPRLARGLLEMSLSKCLEHPGNSSYRILEWCKLFERRLPYKCHVLRHFCYPDVFRETKRNVTMTLEQSPKLFLNEKIVSIFEKQGLSFDIVRDMSQDEIQNFVRKKYDSRMVLSCLHSVPVIKLQVGVRPITNRIAQFALTLESDFVWNFSINGNVEVFRIWVEDPQSGIILYTQDWRLLKSKRYEKTLIEFVLPLYNKTGDLNLTPQYFVHVVSDRWVGIGFQHEFSVHHLIIPDHESRITPLLNLHPLPITCLQKKEYENLYSFDYFNPVQTQIFHTLYHTNQNVLLGAPTGSGKTIAAEFALFHLFNNHPNGVAIYIAPLKALAKERMEDWKCKFEKKLGKKVTELTGDITPDIKILNSCHIIITTPEKFDGISRLWRRKDYLHQVFLVIFDEIHLLGLSRGPILEILVSRLRCMSYHMHRSIRLVGLSTALANVKDIAEWLGVDCRQGLFNFSPSVRPVPCETHIRGFSETHYCPRMASMNKPAYTFIQNFSENKPVLVFVSSRRQTRLTALDLIALRMTDTNAKDETWALHQNDEFLQLLSTVTDTTLQYTIQFGIALHHAGLHIKDRAISEILFKKNYVRILITTSTLAWGVNLPAHLVIIKGTEIYDTKTKSYIDMPLTDVLQMIGRTGRPQYDHHAVVGLFVQESKKLFYRTFVYEPFPLESSLHQCLDDHINAEISNETITCGIDLLNYITWTYFFRRLLINPDYYMNALHCLKKNETSNVQNIELSEHGYQKPFRSSQQHSINSNKDSKKEKIAHYLETLFLTTIQRLQDSKCLQVECMHYTTEESTKKIERQELQLIASLTMHKYKSTFLGDMACRFYVTVQTVFQFDTAMTLHSSLTWVHILQYLCNAPEYQQLPVRHNEDKMNEEFSQLCFISSENSFESPYCKAFLLLQAHLFSLPLPITDYVTDLKSVLDQCIRILLCFLHIALWKHQGMTFLHGVLLLQSIIQGVYPKANPLLCIPTLKSQVISDNNNEFHITSLPELIESDTSTQINYLTRYTTCPKTALHWIQQYPILRCCLSLVESPQDVMSQIHFSKSHYVHSCVFHDTMTASPEFYEYNIHLRLNVWYTNEPSHEIYSDVFSRFLPYSWWIVFLDSQTYQVQYHTSLKKISSIATLPSKHDLHLRVTLTKGQSCYWKCFLLSDTFMGCDQEMQICFTRNQEKLVEL